MPPRTDPTTGELVDALGAVVFAICHAMPDLQRSKVAAALSSLERRAQAEGHAGAATVLQQLIGGISSMPG